MKNKCKRKKKKTTICKSLPCYISRTSKEIRLISMTYKSHNSCFNNIIFSQPSLVLLSNFLCKFDEHFLMVVHVPFHTMAHKNKGNAP